MPVSDLFDYFKGQGQLFYRDAGTAGEYKWFGDVPSFEFGQNPTQLKVKENYTGNRGNALTLVQELDTTFSINVRNIAPEVAALLLSGTAVDVNSGTVTNEAFTNPVTVGGYNVLAKNGVITSLVITDSAGSPLTLVLNTHYTHDGYGLVKFLATPGTQPYKAAYSYAASKVNLIQNTAIADKELLFLGKNTARKNASGGFARCRLKLYKCSVLPGETIPFIQADAVAEIALNGSFNIDTTRATTSTTSQYGELVYDDLT